MMLLAVTLLVVLLTGCQGDPTETRAWWDQRIERLEANEAALAEQAAAVQATLETIAADLSALPDDSDVAAKLRDTAAAGAEVLADVLGRREQLAAEILTAKAKLAAIPDDATAAEINAQMGGAAVSAVGTFVPAPYGPLLKGVGALIAASGGLLGLLGHRRARKAEAHAAAESEILESTVAAIENAKRTNLKLLEAFGEASGAIRSNLSNEAEVRINEIRTLYGKAAT